MVETTKMGQDRRIAMSISVPLSTYLILAERAQQSGQSLSFVVNRLLLAGLNFERGVSNDLRASTPA